MLLAFALVQGILYCLSLGLLPMSGEEAWTARISAESPSQILAQPPLYFLLAHWWREIPVAQDPLVRLRLLSVIFVVLTTVLIERRWLRNASDGVRDWFLLLWTFSPCLLLFGRMACSFSLQIFLSALVISFALKFAGDFSSRKNLLWLAASLEALLYTHYLPGIAIWAGMNLFLLAGVRKKAQLGFWKAWGLLNVLVAAVFLPWAAMFAGNLWRNPSLKLGIWLYAFAFGEAISVWLLPVTALLALPWLWLLFTGARQKREWLVPGLAAAAIAYLGAVHASSLLFLLPAFLLTIAAGIESKRRVGTVLGILLFGANLAGVWTYFGAKDILNPAYLSPNRQIAAEIVLHSNPAGTVVWVDAFQKDAQVFEYYLPKTFPIRFLDTPESVNKARTDLDSAIVSHIWFLRNSSDASPGQLLEKLENETKTKWYDHSLHPYLPFSPAQLALLHGLAIMRHQPWHEPPRYMYQVWEFRRPKLSSELIR